MCKFYRPEVITEKNKNDHGIDHRTVIIIELVVNEIPGVRGTLGVRLW